jgi:hypothetical protein
MTPEETARIETARETWITTAIGSTDWRLIREKRLLFENLSGEKTPHDNANVSGFGNLQSTVQPST